MKAVWLHYTPSASNRRHVFPWELEYRELLGMGSLVAYCVYSREAIDRGSNTKIRAVRSLKGKAETIPHCKIRCSFLFTNFREVKTRVRSHTASKWWLLDLNLDLAHHKASRLKLLV